MRVQLAREKPIFSASVGAIGRTGAGKEGSIGKHMYIGTCRYTYTRARDLLGGTQKNMDGENGVRRRETLIRRYRET